MNNHPILDALSQRHLDELHELIRQYNQRLRRIEIQLLLCKLAVVLMGLAILAPWLGSWLWEMMPF